jgi:hypothetical protein
MAGGGVTVEGPTEQEQALADVSTETWEAYKADYRPAETALAKKAEFTAGEEAQVKGEVAADTAAAFAGLARSTVATGEQTGAGTQSGRTKLSLAADAEAQGKAVGLGKAAAKTGGEIDSEQQNVKIVGFGRGMGDDATANLSRGAVRATRLALAEAQAKHARNEALNQGLATVAGAAFEAYRSRTKTDPGKANSGINTSKALGGTTGADFNPFENMFPDVLGG